MAHVPSGNRVAKLEGIVSAALANADELGPYSGKNGANQHIVRAITEGAAILAHGGAQRPHLVVAGGVKKGGQDSERCSYKIHCTLREGIKGVCIINQWSDSEVRKIGLAAIACELRNRISSGRADLPHIILARDRFESESKLEKIFYMAAR